jgi:hypothetical protein
MHEVNDLDIPRGSAIPGWGNAPARIGPNIQTKSRLNQ